jgi:tRNA1Val (adenine37-N6)-methyltransferase
MPEKSLLPGETLDDLFHGELKILQGRKGYRFSLDPLLLCSFSMVKPGETVADLGTGSGIIPLLLARRTAAGRILGVEIQLELADRARRSARLNGLEGRIEILSGDLRRISELLPPQSFDVILANPPYREPGTGRQALEKERAAARHALAGGLEDFLRAAFFLLPEGGRFYLIFLAERLAEVLAALRQERLEPKRLRCVHSRAGEVARLALVEGRKRGRPGLVVEAPLYLREGDGYSPEMLRIYEMGGMQDRG